MGRLFATNSQQRAVELHAPEDSLIQLEMIKEELLNVFQTLESRYKMASRPVEPPVDRVSLSGIIKARRLRENYFGVHLFSDPAWDMILELYTSRLSDRRISVSGLCVNSGAPASTALRWLSKLEQEGLVERIQDKNDARRTWVDLTPAALDRVGAYFARISNLPVL